MTQHSTKLLLALPVTATLAACGGGGSGSAANSPVTQFTSVSDLQNAEAVALSGEARIVAYSRNLVTGSVDLVQVNAPQTSTLRANLSDGDITALNQSSASGSFDLDFTADAETVNSGGIAIMNDADTVAIFSDPTESEFDHSSFGTWLQSNNPSSGTIGVGSYGAKTAQANMPVSGSASYSGYSVGFAERHNGDLLLTESDITVSTPDFSTVNISSTNTYTTNVTGFSSTRRATDMDFSGSGTISGSDFTANIATGTSVVDLTGSADGSFYGPNAAEVGGTFELSNTRSRTTYVGAYGALGGVSP